MNEDTGSDPGAPKQSVPNVYGAINEHWTHAEQVRWAVLNNFLLATTIVLLGWTAMYTADPTGLRTVVLVLLSLVGLVLSGSWLAIGVRASGFVNMYTQLGLGHEEQLGIDGPFSEAGAYRDELRAAPKSKRDKLARAVPSRLMIALVPCLFFVTYVVLTIVSLLGFTVGATPVTSTPPLS